MLDRFLLIIGAMKCGTTSLFAYLAQHPQIAPSSIKEPDFFTKDERWAKGLSWYRSLWDYDPSRHKWAMEASTAYTKLPNFSGAVERISSVAGDFRFIYVMRHPIQRIESHYRHATIRGSQHMKKAPDQLVRPHWIACSKYAMQLDPYYAAFPKEHILLLAFEELRDDPTGVLRRVCAFLNVEDFAFKGLGTAHNTSRVDHPVYSFLVNAPIIPRLARLVPVRFKEALRNRISREIPKDVKLTPEQREYCLNELRDDMRRLRDEYGFDISRWNLDVEPAANLQGEPS